MRRVELRTEHGSEAAATAIARAVRPDNTDRIHTAVEDGTVVTTVERERTGGLRATVDDYVVNLRTAAQLTETTDTTETADTNPHDT
ncbi:KEOPS complex subunit Pcc1 [Salinirussus salinus]|jgi:tRNA threonylcarbamoyladenosine modification (KEOPS) complex  Pcc1 subunit|uniref:KEOPS complex subunit Pcc1 n=1 Tax=Salinirussus salinus TaxID=1198300 RepID=UPI001358BF4D|nr:KEOPS complex subunit Pcc1 [Salinirussus salinus]